MKTTVIISTYNQPEWLAKSLCGFANQKALPNEIVVADDGSDKRTLAVISSYSNWFPCPLRHVWHEDRGFRKCEILNKAILESRGGYIIFTDGDCIPFPDFVGIHATLARRGCFLSGGYLKLPMTLSKRVSQPDISSGRAFILPWLRKQGLPFSAKLVKLWAGPCLGPVLDRLTPTKATWNGHSASTFKEYILKANGFDERMGWGGEDRELGERLENMGVTGIQIRNRARCLHLEHSRRYVDENMLVVNKSIREVTRLNNVKRTCCGINRHMSRVG